MNKLPLIPQFIANLVAWLMLSGPAATTLAEKPFELPPRLCPPLISGVLWWINPQTDPANLDKILKAMDDAGMNLLWLLGTPPLAAVENNTLLEQIYRQADRHRWKVIIETSCVSRWYGPWDIAKLKQIDQNNIETVTRRYAHHPSFFGWYLNYEIYMEWDEKSQKIRDLYTAVGRMTRAAAPGTKLTISPFFLADKDHIRADFRYATPAEYGDWWRETIRQAGIDIVMLQDSGAEHCECVSAQTRAEFFAAMQRACKANGAELWGNVETVEYRARDWPEYARRLKRYRESKTEYPWSFDMERNARKLDLASRYSTNIVSWGWEFWNPVVPQQKVGNSVDNYKAYKAYYQRIHQTPTATSSAPAEALKK